MNLLEEILALLNCNDVHESEIFRVYVYNSGVRKTTKWDHFKEICKSLEYDQKNKLNHINGLLTIQAYSWLILRSVDSNKFVFKKDHSISEEFSIDDFYRPDGYSTFYGSRADNRPRSKKLSKSDNF